MFPLFRSPLILSIMSNACGCDLSISKPCFFQDCWYPRSRSDGRRHRSGDPRQGHDHHLEGHERCWSLSWTRTDPGQFLSAFILTPACPLIFWKNGPPIWAPSKTNSPVPPTPPPQLFSFYPKEAKQLLNGCWIVPPFKCRLGNVGVWTHDLLHRNPMP